MTNFIKEYHNAISVKECEKLINFFDNQIASGNVMLSQGEVDNGGGINRKDTAIFLDQVSSQINSGINKIVETCWHKYVDDFPFLMKTAVVSYASKMQKTPPHGGFHTWHWEHNGEHTFRNRLATWTLYLTDHEDEGETEFLAHGLKVKAEAGKFCIFPADYTAVHRGNPVYSKPKYIITGWYEYNN